MNGETPAMNGEPMPVEELQIRRAQLRKEFDALVWRHRRTGERLDALAKELDDLGSEIIVSKIRHEAPDLKIPTKPLKMEMV